MDGTTMSASPVSRAGGHNARAVDRVDTVGCPLLEPEKLGIGHLFWTMRDAVIVGDVSTGTIVLWNPAAERLFGWSAPEVVGASLETIIPEHIRAAHRSGMSRYAAHGCGSLIDGETPVEVPALRKDGTEITVELNLTPLSHLDTNDSGIPRFVIAFVRDATARTQVARERETVLAVAQDYARRLEELATLESGFTAMVAHELGGPVAAIGALARLLERGTLAVDEQRATVQALRAETKILQRLINDIQVAATVERDSFTVRPHRVPVVALVADAIAFARTLADDHPMHDDVAAEALAMQVEADPDRIGQVLRNLLGNAVKHTPAGTGVHLRVSPVNGRVRFDVADTGPGIPPTECARIFTRFGRGRDALDRKTPGTGLGLYLARQIVQAHGSDLSVSVTPGEGTTFSFDLEAST